jgi:hypothetical protein
MSRIEMSSEDREQLLSLAKSVLSDALVKGESILKLLSTQYTTFMGGLTDTSVRACADSQETPTFSNMALGKALVQPVFTLLETLRLKIISELIETPLLAAEQQVKQHESDPESLEYLNASHRVHWYKQHKAVCNGWFTNAFNNAHRQCIKLGVVKSFLTARQEEKEREHARRLAESKAARAALKELSAPKDMTHEEGTEQKTKKRKASPRPRGNQGGRKPGKVPKND